MDSWAGREARRAARNLLVINAVLAVAVVVGIGSLFPHFQWAALIPLAVFGGLLALAVWNLRRGWRAYREPESSTLWTGLGNYSATYGAPESLSAQIEQELPAATRFSRTRLTRSWIVHRHWFSTWVSPMQDVVWFYEKVTRHRVNGIPNGKSYAVLIRGAHGQVLESRMSRRKAERLLSELRSRLPWALYGYDEALKKRWKDDRRGLVAVVQARRQELAGKARSAAT